MNITIDSLQSYLHAQYAGKVEEFGLFMKLVEEIGEVAEVLNMRGGRKAADGEDLLRQLSEELADMIHYTVAIAAVNGIDLSQVILEKDKKASVKYGRAVNLEEFLAAREA